MYDVIIDSTGSILFQEWFSIIYIPVEHNLNTQKNKLFFIYIYKFHCIIIIKG